MATVLIFFTRHHGSQQSQEMVIFLPRACNEEMLWTQLGKKKGKKRGVGEKSIGDLNTSALPQTMRSFSFFTSPVFKLAFPILLERTSPIHSTRPHCHPLSVLPRHEIKKREHCTRTPIVERSGMGSDLTFGEECDEVRSVV